MAVFGAMWAVVLLLLPAVGGFLLVDRLRGWLRLLLLLALLAVPFYLHGVNEDCLKANDGAIDEPCLGTDILAFAGSVLGTSAVLGAVIAAGVRWLRHRLKAKTPDVLQDGSGKS
jgi:hypothetical protein